MGTVVCLPTAENMGRICGHAVDCLPPHFLRHDATDPPGENPVAGITQCKFVDRRGSCEELEKTS